jgi:hypothetical protein
MTPADCSMTGSMTLGREHLLPQFVSPHLPSCP